MIIKKVTKDLNIPDKLFFSIKEVSKILELNASVLRYWEKEFPIIQPKRNRYGHRQYRKNDVIILGVIRELLYNKKYSIQGARQELKNVFPSTKNPKKVIERQKNKKVLPPQKLQEKLDSVINDVETLIQEIQIAI